jgi:phage shock protein A
MRIVPVVIASVWFLCFPFCVSSRGSGTEGFFLNAILMPNIRNFLNANSYWKNKVDQLKTEIRKDQRQEQELVGQKANLTLMANQALQSGDGNSAGNYANQAIQVQNQIDQIDNELSQLGVQGARLIEDINDAIRNGS